MTRTASTNIALWWRRTGRQGFKEGYSGTAAPRFEEIARCP